MSVIYYRPPRSNSLRRVNVRVYRPYADVTYRPQPEITVGKELAGCVRVALTPRLIYLWWFGLPQVALEIFIQFRLAVCC